MFEQATARLANTTNPRVQLGTFNCDASPAHADFCREQQVPCCAKLGYFNGNECPQMQLSVKGMRGGHLERSVLKAGNGGGESYSESHMRDLLPYDVLFLIVVV